VRADQFKAQLDLLAETGSRILPLPDIVSAVQCSGSLPDRAIAITIDDAYRSVCTVAYPILKARKIPFTVFVNTDPVDRHHLGFMTWDQLREMHHNGVTLASHCAAHDTLIEREPGEQKTVWFTRVRQNIERCQKCLETEIGSSAGKCQ
jgi:peptidoglycan/xylan/chitin deacetylase (PgdA/CDA1 family)